MSRRIFFPLLVVSTASTAATLAGLRAAGVPVVGEPEDKPWGERVARVRNPDGRLVYPRAPV
jgi:lactoylglutathione lyase